MFFMKIFKDGLLQTHARSATGFTLGLCQ
jgi:hypothetical protein